MESEDLKQYGQHQDTQRLWVVSEVYYPDETSTSRYLTAIAQGLTDFFDVSVLCGRSDHLRRRIRVPKREKHNDVAIYRCSGTTLNNDLLAFKLSNMLTLSASMFVKGVKYFRRGDKVLVITTPLTMPFIIAIASLLRGSSYTLLFHAPCPEAVVGIGKLHERSFLARTIDFFDRWLYKNARKIIVVGRDMEQLVENKSRSLDIPMTVIEGLAKIEDLVPGGRSRNYLMKDNPELIGQPHQHESERDCSLDVALQRYKAALS